MNHYERLKITQDAPPEVIRAAYRALSQRVPADDPDRETTLTQLNVAYELLRDEAARQDYDAMLNLSKATAFADIDAPASVDLDVSLDDLAGLPSSGQELQGEWTPPPEDADHFHAGASTPAPRTGLWLALAIAAIVGVMACAVWWWKQSSQTDHASRVLSDQFTGQVRNESMTDLPPSQDEADPLAHLSVEDLERMSDEELLAALPSLDGSNKREAFVSDRPQSGARGTSRATRQAQHPLDGDPLALKTVGELLAP